MDPKQTLVRYLNRERDGLVAALDGLGEYEARRPMVASATNLIGLVVHVANVEAGYFGACFGRPFEHALLVPEPTYDADPLADMWVGADVAVADVLDFYAAVRAHAATTIEQTPLDGEGHVPWWNAENNPVSLHRMLVHVATEVARHAGHADIMREVIDQHAGRIRTTAEPLPGSTSWEEHRARVEQAARNAATAAGEPVPQGRPAGR